MEITRRISPNIVEKLISYTGFGTAIGASIGYLIGGKEGSRIGAIVGGIISAITGGIIEFNRINNK